MEQVQKQTNGNTILKAALKYVSDGYPILPIRPDGKKKPYLDTWKEFQSRLPTEAEVREWWTRWPDAWLGIITGQLSGITEIDADNYRVPSCDQEIENRLSDTAVPPIQTTLHKGKSYVFAFTEQVKQRQNTDDGLDVRGSGGYFVVAPSPGYEWEIPLEGKESLEPVPPEIIELLKSNKPEPPQISIAQNYPEPPTGSLDVGQYLDTHKVLFSVRGELDRTIYRLKRCPFTDNHTDKNDPTGGAIIQGANGIVTFHCKHKACANKRWEDARLAISGSELLTYSIEISREAPQAPLNTEFPQETIQGVCKDFANLYSDALESPWAFWAISFLTLLGTCLGDSVKLETSLYTEPRLYTVILGESADARKSEALKQTSNFFDEFLFTQNIGVVPGGIGSGEGLGEQLSTKKNTILLYDELQNFVQKARIDGAVLLQVVGGLFENNIYHAQTKGHKIDINDAHLSMLAASTTDTYSSMFSDTFKNIGFINRLFLVTGDSERTKPIPKLIEHHSKRLIAEHLQTTLALYPHQTTIRIDPGALDLYSEWYKSEARQDNIFSKRLDTYALRLMMLFCVNESKAMVTRNMIERIIQILNWQETIRRVCDPILTVNVIAKMEQKIQKLLLCGELSRGQLRKKCHVYENGTYPFDTAIKNLIKEGIISEKPGRPGRPKEVIYFLTQGED